MAPKKKADNKDTAPEAEETPKSVTFIGEYYVLSFGYFLQSTIMSVLVHENLEADLPINVVASTVEYCVILSGRGLQANFPFPLPAVVTATT